MVLKINVLYNTIDNHLKITNNLFCTKKKRIGKIEVAKRIECCVLTPGISCKMVITSQVLLVTDNLCPVMLQQVSLTRLDTQFSIENVRKNVSI